MIARLLKILHLHPIWSTGVLSVIGMAVILANMFYLSNKMNEEATEQYAQNYLTALDKAGALYSSAVVGRLNEDGQPAINITHDYEEHAGAIPLPATFSIELSDALTDPESGIETRFYSEFPFSFRDDGGPHDEFESIALSKFRFMSDEERLQPFIKFETVDGRRSLRYAEAIIMQESCVACHNSHPASTKRDWKVGDVRGARAVTLPLDTTDKTRFGGLTVTLVVMSTMAAVGLGLIFVVIQALRVSINMLSKTNTAYNRFVPHEFLSYLNKKSIVDVELNDNIEKQMTILFSDIRSFTDMSESMTPEENFKFVNEYLSVMSPVVRRNNGFIDKYIGDAIMALFDTSDDAVQASLEMLEVLEGYNQENRASRPDPIRIGIGVHQGKLRLGTVGERNRMDGTVISDAVNLASRIEELTKFYGVQCLVSQTTYYALSEPARYPFRCIDKVKIRGKKEPVTIYEMFGGDSPELQAQKRATQKKFEEAADLYRVKEFAKAAVLFGEVLDASPEDKASRTYIERCRKCSEARDRLARR